MSCVQLVNLFILLQSIGYIPQMAGSKDQKGKNNMKKNPCAICGGKLRNRKITIDRLVKNQLYLFENVRVQSCEQCHEIWIPGKEAERMDQAIRGDIKPHKKILVPVY